MGLALGIKQMGQQVTCCVGARDEHAPPQQDSASIFQEPPHDPRVMQHDIDTLRHEMDYMTKMADTMLDEMRRLRKEKDDLLATCSRLDEANQVLRADMEQQNIDILERHYRQLEAHRLRLLEEQSALSGHPASSSSSHQSEEANPSWPQLAGGMASSSAAASTASAPSAPLPVGGPSQGPRGRNVRRGAPADGAKAGEGPLPAPEESDVWTSAGCSVEVSPRSSSTSSSRSSSLSARSAGAPGDGVVSQLQPQLPETLGIKMRLEEMQQDKSSQQRRRHSHGGFSREDEVRPLTSRPHRQSAGSLQILKWPKGSASLPSGSPRDAEFYFISSPRVPQD